MTDTTRKLATIVALDVAGYSARTEADEARTTAEVAALRKVIEAIAAKHGGRVFNTAGDGFMLEFGSSLSAVEAAFELAETCEPKVRVGVHLGDVVVQSNGDLLGHGVNVAARLMARSDPGGALVSADVRRTIRGPLAERLVSHGLMRLDKMAETIEAFSIATVATVVAAPIKATEPLLAVLPFDNLSDDREMQFFSDGVSEEILHTIARAKGLKVIGKGSSFQFRGTDKVARKVAAELRATHVLDGSVKRAGNHIRVIAHLVEAASQTTIWTDRYDRELTDVLKLQDEIALAISTALDARLTRRLYATKVDPFAYELYLKARAAIANNWIEADKKLAVALLEQAVARAPDFARAWGLLAFARVLLMPRDRDMADTPEHSTALAAANRALLLDPNCVDTFMAMIALKPAFSEYNEKRKLADAAIELAPNDAMMFATRAAFWVSVGRVRDCIVDFENCVVLEPSLPIYRAGYAAYLPAAGRMTEASAISIELLQLDPSSAVVFMVRVLTFLASGRQKEVEAMLSPSAVLPVGITRSDVDALLSRLRIGGLSASERLAAYRSAMSEEQDPVLQLTFCVLAAQNGHADLAYEQLLAALDRNRQIGERGFSSFGQNRAMATAALFLQNGAALRRDIRFPLLCCRLGLVDYWTQSGRWPDCADEVSYDFKVECEKAARVFTKT